MFYSGLVETIKIKTARRNTREVRARAEAQERSLPTTMTPAIFGSRRTRRTEATVDHQRRATGTRYQMRIGDGITDLYKYERYQLDIFY